MRFISEVVRVGDEGVGAIVEVVALVKFTDQIMKVMGEFLTFTGEL